MTDLNNIENLILPHQENISSVENSLSNIKSPELRPEGTSVVEQKAPETKEVSQETGEVTVSNCSKPSTGYEISQESNDEERTALLLAKMNCEKISTSQD